MMVGRDTVTGTIGGGQLEYLAIDRARMMLAKGETQARMDVPLGPDIGQCCGGRVELELDRARATVPVPGPAILIFGVAPALLSEFRLNLLAKFFCFGIVASGIGLAWGRGGMLTLGQGVYFGVGAYAMAMFLKLSDARDRGGPRRQASRRSG